MLTPGLTMLSNSAYGQDWHHGMAQDAQAHQHSSVCARADCELCGAAPMVGLHLQQSPAAQRPTFSGSMVIMSSSRS